MNLFKFCNVSYIPLTFRHTYMYRRIFKKYYQLFLQAGIGTDQLTLALEPEAASIYCQFVHPRDELNDETHHYDAFRQLVKEKRKYMVVDLGGRFLNSSMMNIQLIN